MNRSIRFPDDLYAAAVEAGLDVPEVCRRALERELGAGDRDQEQAKLLEELAARVDDLEADDRDQDHEQDRRPAAAAYVALGLAVLALLVVLVRAG